MGKRDKQSGITEFQLGECIVWPTTNEVIRDGQAVHLEPKSMEVLVHLVSREGVVVSRDELLDLVWPGIHVGDDSLTGAIVKIRRALGDSARDPRYVETIPKRGYRLMSPVSEISGGAITDNPEVTSRRSPFVLSAIFVGMLFFTAGLAGSLIWWPGEPKQSQTEDNWQATDRIAIAVAPFVNANNDMEEDYLAQGIGDSILNDLARVRDFSVRQLRRTNAAEERRLGFDYLLEGSVLRSGETIRVDSRLVDAKSSEILLSLRLDRPFVDLLTIEDDIRKGILDKLARSINSNEHSRKARGYTENLAAYDTFLRAQSKLLIRTRDANLSARALYQDAIRRDPNFARAYGGLALTYAADYRNGWTKEPNVALESALRYAKTAIGIAPDLPEQHWVVGYVKTQHRLYNEARVALGRAIELDPEFADAYALSGGIETYSGNPAQTVPMLREAIRFNPDAGYLYFLLISRAYYFLGDFDQAKINLDEAIARNPENVEAHLYLAATLVRLRQGDDAEWETEEVLNIEPGFTLDNWSAGYPMVRGEQFDRLLADLRDAGFS